MTMKTLILHIIFIVITIIIEVVIIMKIKICASFMNMSCDWSNAFHRFIMYNLYTFINSS